MALQRFAVLVLALACTELPIASAIQICPTADYVHRAGSGSCYLYHHIEAVFSSANRTCVRVGSTMVIIDSEAENVWLMQNMYTGEEFWLGMHDQSTEGTFRWINGSTPSYTAFAASLATDNTNSLDCVKFTATGWTVHSEGCGAGELPFICEATLCESDDGETCNMPVMTSSGGGVDIAAIAIVVILVLIIVIVIVVAVLLVFMWKFHNDAFNRYCCCCVRRKSKVAVHSLQQENQRLRHELSQRKLSLTGSGRYSQGMFATELSGVPDGRGGVLPTIKPTGKPPMSPTIYEDRPISLGLQPPPLIPQRGRVTPTFSRIPSQPPMSPPGVFTSGPRPPPVTLGGLSKAPPVTPVRQVRLVRRLPSGATPRPLLKPPVKRDIFEEVTEPDKKAEPEAPPKETTNAEGVEGQVKPASQEEGPKAESSDEESGSSEDETPP